MNGGLTEVFSYDALNRLSGSTLNGAGNLSVSLDGAGNILTKDGVAFGYDPTYKRALTSAGSSSYAYDANGNMTSRAGSTISYYSYDLPSTINASGLSSTFSYSANRQRWRQVATFADGAQTTIYVAGLMEKIRTPNWQGYRHYVQAGNNVVVYTRWCDGTTNTFYVLTDNLGSTSAVTCGPDVAGCATGNVFVAENFAAYGARRGPGWSGVPSAPDLLKFAQSTRRGFTGHEMLDNIGLVHMNGRVYDPALGRFLSADRFIDPALGSQGFNRYAYVGNNPLSLTDPTGFCSGTLDVEQTEGPSWSQGWNACPWDQTYLLATGNGFWTDPYGLGIANAVNAGGVANAQRGVTSSGEVKEEKDKPQEQKCYAPPISDAESAAASRGDRRAFWTSRYERGDPIGGTALSILNNEGWTGGAHRKHSSCVGNSCSIAGINAECHRNGGSRNRRPVDTGARCRGSRYR